MDRTPTTNQAATAGFSLDRLLTLQEVRLATTFGRSTIYRLVDAGDFPRPIKIGPNRIAWKSSSIAEWMAHRPLAA
ncbi:MAG: DNA-binding protein [Hyphomicrobium sp.]|nr:MAG: DNA-binding protein [Hyphomicrobium sp.]